MRVQAAPARVREKGSGMKLGDGVTSRLLGVRALRVPAIVAVAALAAVIVAGCGGSSGGSSSTGTTSNAARETAFLNYAQCMRQHGVAVSDPTVGANGIVRLPRPTLFQNGQTPTSAQLAQFQQARTACQSTIKGITFGFNPSSNPQFQAALLKYAQCMRANGFNMPDPTFNNPGTSTGTGTGTGGFRGPFGGINRNNPTFQKANTVCRPILQAAGFGFRGGGGGTGTSTGAAGSGSGSALGQGAVG
jgi:hypothetical protein